MGLNHDRLASRLHADTGGASDTSRGTVIGFAASRGRLRGAAGRASTPICADERNIATIARAVEAERHCCRFLRFGITVEPDGGPVFLELTGPPGTREFIGALFEV